MDDKGAGFEPSDDDLDSLVTSEREFSDNESEQNMARRLLRENLPRAVLGIVQVARSGSNERIRYDANKYIIERNLGRIGDDIVGGKDPLEQFVADLEAFANEKG